MTTASREVRSRLADSSAWSNATVHLTGWSLLVVGIGQVLSAGAGLLRDDPRWSTMAACGVVVAGASSALVRTTSVPNRVSTRTAFVTVTVVWLSVCIVGAIPFWLMNAFPHWDDALFESISGFTATGSTVLSDIEGQPGSLLFWRQVTQWIGGIGFVVLALAVLPVLGIGGMELLQAETPGPSSDRLAPRIADTARHLSVVYLVLTTVSSIGFAVVGMDLFDSVGHAMTAVATGGFSPYNDSIAHFDSQAVEVVAIGSMFLGAINFALFFHAFRRRTLVGFWRSGEFRFYLGLLTGATLFCWVALTVDGYGQRALRDSAFNVMSLMSTCGFGTADFTQWVPAPQLVLLFVMVAGSMAGSTSGALKLFRIRVLISVAKREVRRVRNPRGVFAIKEDTAALPEKIVSNIVGYSALYFLVVIAGVVVLTALGVDLVTGSGSVITAMGGVGPGLADTGPASNFLTVTRPSRGVLGVLMLLGRLEIVPVLMAAGSLGRLARRR